MKKNQLFDAQQAYWERNFSEMPEMFGPEPSDAARHFAALLQTEGKKELLELGAGQGRDTLFFASGGFKVHALDYSQTGLDALAARAEAAALPISTLCRDVRQPLPFADASLDACYSHMLFCMALRTADLEFLLAELRRVLRPGGLCVYTARHTGDPHYGQGPHHGEDIYESGGFIIHFFSREKVDHLAQGYNLEQLALFEEGPLPRKLIRVTMRKP